jgi:peptidoglycan/xylan/chitin deacetylase (PgdA/CDA1 family)
MIVNSNKYFDYLLYKVKHFIYNSFFEPKAVILMFHRFVDSYENVSSPMHNNEVSIDFLERLITNLKINGCKFITMDELHDLIATKSIRRSKSKYVVLSIDDGYKDLMTKALPIFEKYNVPFTFYLSNSFVNKTATIWWYDLEKYIFNEYGSFTKDALKSFYRFSRELLKSGDRVLTEIEKITKKDYDVGNQYDLTIDTNDLISLSGNSLCTIAVHTNNHYSLRYLNKTKLNSEIVMAIDDFNKRNINFSDHFAYPYGSAYSIGKREVAFSSKFFKTSVSTYSGFIYRFGNNLHLLPRLNVLENDYFSKKIRKFVGKNSINL